MQEKASLTQGGYYIRLGGGQLAPPSRASICTAFPGHLTQTSGMDKAQGSTLISEAAKTDSGMMG